MARQQLTERGAVRLRGRERRPGACSRAARGDRRPRARPCRYHGAAMIHPRIDELMDKVDSRYALVIVAAKRARQINNYHHQLGEGTFDEFAPPLIESRSKNYLTMALEETAEGKIVYEYPKTARRSRHDSGHVPDPPGRHRRHRGLQGLRADAPARQGGPRGDPARHRGRAALRDRGDVPGAGTAPAERGRLRAPDPRRPARRRALHREHPREAGARDRRQRPDRGRARAPRPDPRRPGDEPAHVGGAGDPRERRHAARPRGRARRPRRGRDGRRRVGRRPARGAGPDRRARRAAARARGARRQADPRHRRRHAESRSTPSATSATGPPAAWASRSPPKRAAAAPR